MLTRMQKILLLILLGLLSCYVASAHAAYDDIDNKKPIALSLDEALVIALRENPNVQSAKLGYVLQKFSLWVQEWEFYPHFSIAANAGVNQNRSNNKSSGGHNFNIQPQMTWTSPIGTNVTVTGTNNKINHYNPGLSAEIVQPLMRGFGRAVVENALFNARDSLITTGLSLRGSVQSMVTNIIDAYLNVVDAEKRIKIDEAAVKRAEESVQQTKLFIKAGRKAGNELVTVQANVATAKSTLEADRNALAQARYALLTEIGLDPNTPVTIASLDIPALIKKYKLPTLEETKGLALENDIPYQTADITLHGRNARQVLVAKDQARWQLNLTSSLGSGNGSGGGLNSGFNSLFNGANQRQSVGLSLIIPIDDQRTKQGILNAKVALQQAELGIKTKRWRIQTNAINGWNLVQSSYRTLQFAKDAERLQEKTYNVNYQKYLHGLIDSLELQSAQIELTRAQGSYLNAQIQYLKSLVNLDQLIGHTLETWQVKVRLK